MKKLPVFLFFIFVCLQMCAQSPLFVRIYDPNGKAIKNGYVLTVSDSSLLLKTENTNYAIPVDSIGKIKTKRSGGNNVLIGSLAGAVTMAIIVGSNGDNTPSDPYSAPFGCMFCYTKSEGVVGGVILGLPLGAVIGGITALAKNPKTFEVNGDFMKWKDFQNFWVQGQAK